MKRMISVILTAALCCVAVLQGYPAFSVAAEEQSFDDITDPGVPRNFNNENMQDPYGYGEGVPFLLSEQNELFFMHNYNGSSTVRTYDTLKSQLSNTGRVVESFQSVTDQTKNSTVQGLSFSKAVSFDPTGSGRCDHVAVVGVSGGKLNILFYDTGSKKWSNAFSLGEISWMNDCSDYYQMQEFISVTAGDYDGDGKDTVVVYAAFSDGYGLYEVSMNPVGSSPAAVKKNASVNRSALNPAYNTVSEISGFVSSKDEDGRDRLVCVLATGDINGDGIDDLAALSHGLGNRYYYDVNYVIPYLSVITGKKGAPVGRKTK